MSFDKKTLPDYIPQWIQSKAHSSKDVTCQVCATPYVGEVDYSDGWHDRGSSTYVTPCPTCNYSKELESKIKKELADGISVTFDCRGTARFNIEVLVEAVNKSVRAFWKESLEKRGTK